MRKRDTTQYEIEYADVIRDEPTNQNHWRLDAKGQTLLKEGWEPFSVTNVSIYRPELEPPIDSYSERVWFRRER
jgi:hypothetical protein